MLPYALIALCIQSITAAPTTKELKTPLQYSLPLFSARNWDAPLIDRAPREASKLRTRYAPTAGLTKRQTEVTIQNVNSDSSYYSEILLGSETVPRKVLVDTGSGDLWLASPDCDSCSQTTDTYSHAASSSLVHQDETFSIKYGSGEASGYLVSDSVQWGGYTVANQTFALCDQVSEGLLTGQVSGLLGLGFESIANSDATPFWQAANINEISFALSRYLHDPDASASEPGGVLTLGGTNTSLYQGDIEFHNLASETYWLLKMDSFRVNGQDVSSTTKHNAAIDTGTSLIGAPVDQVADIYAQISGAFRSQDESYAGYYEYPCDAEFTTSIAFDGMDYPIYARDFNLGTTSTYNDTQYCLGAVFELTASGLPDWIIGNTFLKSYYTVFRADPPSVGFGNLTGGPVFSSYLAESSSSLVKFSPAILIPLLILSIVL